MSSINQVASQIQAVFSPPGEAASNQVNRSVAEEQGAATKPVESGSENYPAGVKATPDQLDKAVGKTNDFLRAQTTLNVQFSVDKDTSRTIVKVVDVSTKEVVRQIPTEDAIDIAKSLDRLQGLLLKDKA